ncbi:MAG: SpoIID/LytB domain-containing protein, partial [Polyangiaceae bacterium]
MWARPGSVALLAAALAVAGCSEPRERELIGSTGQAVSAPLPAAYCSIDVNGASKDAEADYLPHVITCENGGASLEALKAQAIAARSVAYYAMATKGTICDGQGCQVYTCGATPAAKHLQAVQETAGQYLSHSGLLTYGFYVAGDTSTAPPSCKGTGTSGTEKYVTYNEGKTGADVQMTTLGYIPPGQPIYGQNRGCMGQWGARCLENDKGYAYDAILRFYYGADIQILQGSGPCIVPVNQPPQGYLDEAGCSTIRGWAYDPDQKDAALDVQIYIDVGPGAAGASPIAVVADVHRDDLCTAIGSCEHGFELPTPASLLDGQSHSVWAVAIDASGAPEAELTQSPLPLTCSGGAGGAGGSVGSGGSGGDAGSKGGGS